MPHGQITIGIKGDVLPRVGGYLSRQSEAPQVWTRRDLYDRCTTPGTESP